MKFLARCLPLLLLLCSTAAFPQLPTGTVKHVIVIIQENRPPDNLFAADSTLITAGANVYLPGHAANCSIGAQTLQPYYLDACFDPNHGHASGWILTYDGGAMDGACKTQVTNCTTSNCCAKFNGVPVTGSVQDTYVDNSPANGPGSAGIVQPYFDIANNFGFANYMFQTNQGPSFPAHQFLFSGTSAPDVYGDPYGVTTNSATNMCIGPSGTAYPCWEFFAAENPPQAQTGCLNEVPGPTGNISLEVDPIKADININNGLNGEVFGYVPPVQQVPGSYTGMPCYKHPSEYDVLKNTSYNWKYYSPFTNNVTPSSSYWNATDALQWVCQPVYGQGSPTCGMIGYNGQSGEGLATCTYTDSEFHFSWFQNL